MPRKVNKLSDLSIDEVSLVDQPANEHARVVLSKRDEEDETEEGSEEEASKADPDGSGMHVPGTEDEEDEEKRKRKKKEKSEEYEKGFFSTLVDKILGEDVSKTHPGQQQPFQPQQPQPGNVPFGQQMQGQPAPGPQGQMPGQPGMGGPQAFPSQGMQQPGQMQAAPPLPDEVVQYIRQLEQQVAEQQGQQSGQEQNPGKEDDKVSNPFGKRDEDLTEDEQSFLQELAKNLEDDDQREAINKAMEAVQKADKRASDAEEIAKAERDHRLTEEYVAKAKSFVGLPVNPDEFGPVLKRLHETMPSDDVEKIESALSAANETIASGGFFSEFGKNTAGEFEPVSKIDQKAQELVDKSDDGLSMEAARAQVLETNPGLYDEYLRDTERKG